MCGRLKISLITNEIVGWLVWSKHLARDLPLDCGFGHGHIPIGQLMDISHTIYPRSISIHNQRVAEHLSYVLDHIRIDLLLLFNLTSSELTIKLSLRMHISFVDRFVPYELR